MTTDSTSAERSAQMISSMFALLPIPVAISDQDGRIVLANSSFTETFQGISNIASVPQQELNITGAGTFAVHTVPLDDCGFKIVYATDVSDRVQLRRRVEQLERLAAVGKGFTDMVRDPAPLRQVEGLMTLARVTPPKHMPVQLNDVVREVLETCGYPERARGFDLTLQLAPDLPCVVGDPSQIEQVIMTLLINAEDAVSGLRGRRGSIQIRTEATRNRVQLHVVDNGLHDSSARVFEPNRNGLGLSLCADIVKDQGGELYVWNPYGNGSTYTFELPVHLTAVTEDSTSMSLGKSLQGKSVMVIDDEAHFTRFIYDALNWHGATIQAANSGSDAYEHLRAKRYDLVICGRLFPGLTGQNLYRLLQSWMPTFDHRFLFITSDVVTAQTWHFFS